MYIFLDESGNFDFSKNGTEYLILTSVTINRPFHINSMLDNYKYDCIEYGLQQEYFHCAWDNSHIRKRIFGFITDNVNAFNIISIVLKKSETNQEGTDPYYFYSEMLGKLIQQNYILRYQMNDIFIITDTLPVTRLRKTIEKSIKGNLSRLIPKNIPFRMLHHSSRSHYGLQIADYCSWAIWRKWERNDYEFYNKIEKSILGEYEIIFDRDKMTPSTTPVRERAPWTLVIEGEPLI